MSLLVTAARFWWLALAAGVLQGCGGKVIALGDGALVAGAGGSAGAGAGTAGAGATHAGGGGMGSGGISTGAGASAAGGSAAVGPNDAGAGGAGPECVTGQVAANEVLWIGDSWVTLPVTGSNITPASAVQRQRVLERAREALLVASDEDYECSAVAAADMAAVAKQYADRQAIQPVKVLLMDGGTWDPIAAQLAGGSVDDVDAAVANSIATFEQFLLDVAADGSVEHIVYYMVPPLPTIPRVDDMRPVFEDACNASAVPCHFLNLGDVWLGHEDEYSNGIQASPAGAVAIGDEIWKIMVDECIAQ